MTTYTPKRRPHVLTVKSFSILIICCLKSPRCPDKSQLKSEPEAIERVKVSYLYSHTNLVENDRLSNIWTERKTTVCALTGETKRDLFLIYFFTHKLVKEKIHRLSPRLSPLTTPSL